MSVTRIAEALQPAWIRTTGVVSESLQASTRKLVLPWRIAGGLAIFVLDPIALAAFVLALWRLGVDLNWTEGFLITQGVFSHWQVWLAFAIGLKFAHFSLSRTMRRVARNRSGARS